MAVRLIEFGFLISRDKVRISPKQPSLVQLLLVKFLLPQLKDTKLVVWVLIYVCVYIYIYEGETLYLT